jgi:hypothetical protein
MFCRLEQIYECGKDFAFLFPSDVYNNEPMDEAIQNSVRRQNISVITDSINMATVRNFEVISGECNVAAV